MKVCVCKNDTDITDKIEKVLINKKCIFKKLESNDFENELVFEIKNLHDSNLGIEMMIMGANSFSIN